LFEKINKLSDEIKLSRSQIFSQAVKYFIDRKTNLELVRRINRAYSDIIDEGEVELLERSKQKYAEIIEEEWQ
jgi:metal-responsive CopG/Arc/MetJ family transcriptional regulator